jgi:hypothetical protein
MRQKPSAIVQLSVEFGQIKMTDLEFLKECQKLYRFGLVGRITSFAQSLSERYFQDISGACA